MRLLLCLVSLVSLAFLPTAFSQCGCASGFPPTGGEYSMILGDASCVLNYLEVFDTRNTSIFASGNVSSHVGPFNITCPGSSISSFSFNCNDGSDFPLDSYAALTTLSNVTCANGQAASIVGLNNVCGGVTVGTIGEDPTTGTCSVCTPGTCPATACSSLTCALGPSPLYAPWPMMGQDAAHRSTSRYSGPQLQPTVAWSEGGGAHNGVTIGNDGTVFSSIGSAALISAYDGQSGKIAWTTLNASVYSTTYTVGPAYLLFGSGVNGPYPNPYMFSSATGEEENYFPFYTFNNNTLSGPTTDIMIGADLSIAVVIDGFWGCVLKSYTSTSDFSCQILSGTPFLSIPAVSGGFNIFSGNQGLFNLQFISSPTPHLQSVWPDPFFTIPLYGSPSSPSISIDNTQVYLGTSTGYALSVGLTTGTLTWAMSPCPQACSMGVRTFAVPSADGTKVFFPMGRAGPSGYAGVIALSTAGATQWTLSTNGDPLSLALDASGLLFVGDSSGSIYGVRAASGAVVWLLTVSGAVANLAIGANSFLYIATNTSLVALH